jgi:penicillin V acylase-like amidase (Ntn superfamily)
LSRAEGVEYLESLKADEQRFVRAVALGERIKKLCNEDDLVALKELINATEVPMIP